MMTETTDQQAAVQTLAPSQWIRFVVLSLILPSILLLCGGISDGGRAGPMPS